MPVARDGRVHPVFRHTPSTLRSSCVSPNLQNIPRGDDSEVQALVKQMFVAPPGNILVARDFSGIEAVLVGYHAGSRDYIRLAKLGVHDYFNAFALEKQGKLPATDLPDLKWSDADLSAYLKSIKKRFPVERNVAKRCVHASNYRVGPSKLSSEYPVWFPKPKDAAILMALYFEVFPEISKWHERICRQVDKEPFIKNSFGHGHRFYQVMNWSKVGNEWTSDYGDDAKRLIAFLPQSDAALIGKRALKRCYYNYPDSVGQWLRLFIHDELFCEAPIARADECDSILEFEMGQPIPEMRLDPSWMMGDYLTIGTEGKRGFDWGSMH